MGNREKLPPDQAAAFSIDRESGDKDEENDRETDQFIVEPAAFGGLYRAKAASGKGQSFGKSGGNKCSHCVYPVLLYDF